MSWYAYCIAERQAFPELCRHRRPMPLSGITGLFGNQTFLFPASDLAVIVSEHNIDEWPNGGLSPVPGKAGVFAYGFIPPGLFARVKAEFLGLARRKKSGAVRR